MRIFRLGQVERCSSSRLGEALNLNIKRCKYVKPTPVQRYALPISLCDQDLMGCAQTGSGKAATFCFPITSIIMSCSRSAPSTPSFSRMACPLALILPPTKELSVEVSFSLVVCVILCLYSKSNSISLLPIHEEARKFAYQTGVRLVVCLWWCTHNRFLVLS